jgi:hypothetical protein
MTAPVSTSDLITIVDDVLDVGDDYLRRAAAVLDKAKMLSTKSMRGAAATNAARLVVASMAAGWPFWADHAVAAYGSLRGRVIVVHDDRVKFDSAHHAHPIENVVMDEHAIGDWERLSRNFVSGVGALISIAANAPPGETIPGWPDSIRARRSLIAPMAFISLGRVEPNVHLDRSIVFSLPVEEDDKYIIANARLVTEATLRGTALRRIGEEIGARFKASTSSTADEVVATEPAQATEAGNA